MKFAVGRLHHFARHDLELGMLLSPLGHPLTKALAVGMSRGAENFDAVDMLHSAAVYYGAVAPSSDSSDGRRPAWAAATGGAKSQGLAPSGVAVPDQRRAKLPQFSHGTKFYDRWRAIRLG